MITDLIGSNRMLTAHYLSGRPQTINSHHLYDDDTGGFCSCGFSDLHFSIGILVPSSIVLCFKKYYK